MLEPRVLGVRSKLTQHQLCCSCFQSLGWRKVREMTHRFACNCRSLKYTLTLERAGRAKCRFTAEEISRVSLRHRANIDWPGEKQHQPCARRLPLIAVIGPPRGAVFCLKTKGK